MVEYTDETKKKKEKKIEFGVAEKFTSFSPITRIPMQQRLNLFAHAILPGGYLYYRVL